MKSLKEISLQIDEPTYRLMQELSYSQISRFQSVGFDKDKLEEKVSSASLSFGSCVDALITGGEEEFNSHFFVTELPNITESASNCVKILWNKYNDTYKRISEIPEETLNTELQLNGFWPSDKYSASSRIKGFFKNPVEEYYELNYIADGKQVLSKDEYNNVLDAVSALKTSEATSYYFQEDNPWEPHIERLYQLKFRADFNGIGYRCMMDECIVDHKEKTILPIDLKTSRSCEEDKFYFNFLQWHYQLQARLYSRILKDVISHDPYFKDFKILNYKFIFCNANTKNPKVWEFEDTHKDGTLYYGRHNSIGMPDPEDLGRELYEFLKYNKRPDDIFVTNKANSLKDFLNTL